MDFLSNCLKKLSGSSKIQLWGALALVALMLSLLMAGFVSESTVVTLRKMMNRGVSGEVTDYYLRKLNFFVWTLIFSGLFFIGKNILSLYFSKLYDHLKGWLKDEGFTERGGLFLLFSFWMGIFFRAESYLCSHFWNDTLALICSIFFRLSSVNSPIF